MTTVSIIGGSGYGGGELLRLLLGHPQCGSEAGDFAVAFGRVCVSSPSESAQADSAQVQRSCRAGACGCVVPCPAAWTGAA